ncbi:MAG: zinc ABC transporter substrate-binding protein [Deltaproteobacteria bacterium]|nr:zinc ABC transporter substrate-binding protein [Deltaproteobacteria bacterium]
MSYKRRLQKMILSRVVLFGCLGMLVVLFACHPANENEANLQQIRVVASIYPLADFVRNVGGDRVVVMTLLPPGASPHVFSPAPRDLAKISGARLFVKIGLGFEFWAEGFLPSETVGSLEVVDTSRGIRTLDGAVGQPNGGRIANPHLWLDPLRAMEQVGRIRDALIRIDPAHRMEYEKNTRAYLAQLQQLDREIRATVATFPKRLFVAIHPSWRYFARRYGLPEGGVIEKTPGKEPTPTELIRMVQRIRKAGGAVIVAEPQLNDKAARVLAAETGAVIVRMDPLGTPGDAERSTYLKLMRYNLSHLKRGYLTVVDFGGGAG